MKASRNYQKCIVSFIDILGFKSLIENSDKDSEPVKRILEIFQEFNQIANRLISKGDMPQKVDTRFFSDCVVRMIPIGEIIDWEILQVLDFEVYQLMMIQMGLLEKGVFIRGCINMGDMYFDRHLFFGPAFNEAYKYESEKAKNPIIVVSDSLMNYLHSRDACLSFDNLRLLINKDYNCINHPQPYLNYLYAMSKCITHNSLKRAKEFFEIHRMVISKELQNHRENEKVLAKYQWLNEYHNHYNTEFSI